MDAATTERFVKRFLEGMEFEAGRTGPPEGFPKFPSIPGGRYTDPAFLEAAFARLLLHDGVGYVIVRSHRVYGKAAGPAMSEWLGANGQRR